MLSRFQELKKEEEALLKIKATLQDQLNRLKVEELALRSMISAKEENPAFTNARETAKLTKMSMEVDNETIINQTELQLNTAKYIQCSEEEEEESDS
ncbi:snRNA-activating protein complex subunit 5 [Latimeria chalumnae]|uniref:Small nuclear RNA activating complex polypeptide 5 n=1 Tax=Latimeria chalumnae TaxID=7897 RepID=H3A673_LATCH|nr:PREDICTED: snRNA-activating protein complex subunit 5 [Latimeria chalumnae]|eukprot:XP_005990157.1 PREDICTED: snRNA-activating protein complex subunit 5 [Latimeria chalumnae]